MNEESVKRIKNNLVNPRISVVDDKPVQEIKLEDCFKKNLFKETQAMIHATSWKPDYTFPSRHIVSCNIPDKKTIRGEFMKFNYNEYDNLTTAEKLKAFEQGYVKSYIPIGSTGKRICKINPIKNFDFELFNKYIELGLIIQEQK